MSDLATVTEENLVIQKDSFERTIKEMRAVIKKIKKEQKRYVTVVRNNQNLQASFKKRSRTI